MLYEGENGVKEYIEDRVHEIADYIIKSGDTVRGCAKRFKVSKSTVHKDISERLKKINRSKYQKVCKVLEKNKAERHIRGGNATHLKYKQKQSGGN